LLAKQICNPFIRTFFFKSGSGGEIVDNSIPLSKLEQIFGESLLGNYDPVTGNVKVVNVGDGLKFVGDTLETDITIDGWDGEVNTRNDLPITVGDPPVGSVYLVLQPITESIMGIPYKTYQSGLYLRSFNTGALTDWERMNVKTQFTDAEFKVVDADNTSRQAKFDVGGVSSGTVRSLTVQDKDLTIAGLDDITTIGAENIGTEGEELFKQIANKLIQIKKIVGKGDVNITSNVANDTVEIELTVPATQWGGIQGTLSDQTDLQNALDTKIEGATNIGTEGIGVFKQVTNKINELKKIVGKGDVNVTENVANDTIEIELTIPTVTISWGDIQGTLSNQTDLQNALDAKIDGAENIGTEGEELFKQIANKLIQIKKIVGKGDVNITSNVANDTVEIELNVPATTKVVSYSSIAINNFNSNALTNVSNMQVTIAKIGDYSFVSTINCSNDNNEEVEVTLAITPISSRNITLIDGTVQALTAGVQFSFVKQLQFDTQKKNQDQTLQRDFIINGLLVGDLIDVQLNTRGDNVDIDNRWLTGFSVS